MQGGLIYNEKVFSDILSRFINELEEFGKVEAAPKLEGKKMIVVLAPKK